MISAHETQITFCATEELMTNLGKIKNLWSHKNVQFSYGELFLEMSKQVLKTIDPEMKCTKVKRTKETKCTTGADRAYASKLCLI